jgi:hypothetical protein
MVRRVGERGESAAMKTKKTHRRPVPDEPMNPGDPQTAGEDPFYGHSEWVDPEMKQAVSQEERRLSRHRGKTIRRPQGVARTMGS